MQHRMTVGAYWPKIRDRINLVLLLYASEWYEMMDMYKILSQRTIHHLKIETAHCADATMMGDAEATGTWVALVTVYQY